MSASFLWPLGLSPVLTCNFFKFSIHFYKCTKVHWKRWWINQKFVISFCFLTKKKARKAPGHIGCFPCLPVCRMGCLDFGPNLTDVSDLFLIFYYKKKLKYIPITQALLVSFETPKNIIIGKHETWSAEILSGKIS